MWASNLTPGSGKWTDAEKKKFERGVALHGWGQWSEISTVVTTRTGVQVKSHAQKVSVEVDLMLTP